MNLIDAGHPHFDTMGSLDMTPMNSVTYRSKATGGYFNVRIHSDGHYSATRAMYNGDPHTMWTEIVAWGESTFDVLDAVHAQR